MLYCYIKRIKILLIVTDVDAKRSKAIKYARCKLIIQNDRKIHYRLTKSIRHDAYSPDILFCDGILPQ